MHPAIHGQATHLDPTDIPVVPAGVLQAMINLVVERGQALILFHGAPPATRSEIERAFWQAHAGDRTSGNATLIRFWHLVDAMSARRLKNMFLDRGYAALTPLAACAASTRLNVHWGFKPQHFVAALMASAPAASQPSTHRLAA